MKKIFFINNFASLVQKTQTSSNFKIILNPDSDNYKFINASDIAIHKLMTDDVDALVVRTNCNVNNEMLNLFPKARFVLRAGHGFDNIDVAECCKRGIYVFTTTGVFTDATADLAIGLMLDAARHISQANASMHDRKWARSNFTGLELRGAKVGIIGLGSVGSAVAERLLSFGCEILVYDPYKNPNSQHQSKLSEYENQLYKKIPDITKIEESVKFVSFLELLQTSDIITLHAPLTIETLQMIGTKELIMMKNSAILINTARGKLINEQALYNALINNEIAGAAVDTFAEEPPTNSKLLKLENLIATPHLGSRTHVSLDRAVGESEKILTQTLLHHDFSCAINFDFIQ